MKQKLRLMAAAAGLAVLAGCQTGAPPRSDSPPVARLPSGVEGEWVGTDGVAVSSLRGGTFTSRSATTGEQLTRGSYVHRDPRTIELSFFSLRTERTTSAACLLVSPSQMNCTLADGNNFVLQRRGVS